MVLDNHIFDLSRDSSLYQSILELINHSSEPALLKGYGNPLNDLVCANLHHSIFVMFATAVHFTY